jgi:raffinose/stachyose/melibiose transport system substrate-binding protein
MAEIDASRRLTREDVLRRGAAFAAGAGIFGGTIGNAFARPDASKNLQVWAWQPRTGNGYPDVFDAAGKRWEAAHKGGDYRYTIIDFPSYFTKFKTASAGGNPPDVMEMSWTGQYHDLVAAKTLAPLDSLLKSLPKFYPAVLNSLRVNGKVYAIPLDLNTLTIAYNKDVFAKLGLKVPRTLDQLIALAKPIRDGGFQPMSVNIKDGWPDGDLWFAQVAYTDRTDKAIRRAETGQLGWRARPFLQAAENVKRMKDAGLFADGAESLDFNTNIAAFATGRVAMTYPHGNFTTGIIAKAVGSRFKWDLFPFPPPSVGPKARATGGPAIIWSVPAKAKNPEGAFEYMRLTTDAVGFKALIKENFIPSAKANIATNPSAIYRRMVSFQPTAATRAIFVPEVYAALLNSMQALMNGDASAQDVVNSLAKAAKK